MKLFGKADGQQLEDALQTASDVVEHEVVAEQLGRRQVPLEIHENLKAWLRIANILRIVFILLGCIATVSGLIATTFNEQLGIFWTKFCTCSAAASIGLLTAFDISGKANAMKRACRNLRAAIMLYKWDPTYTINDLIAEYRKGQDLVGDVNYIPQRTAPDTKKTRTVTR